LKKLIIKGMDKRYFSEKLVKWYKDNHRNLPWRATRDPYRIWLSEIILQQTRVSQGLPYYERFVEKYPTVKHLAAAPEQDVLRLWQGLGYYTRARNLHRCAIKVATEMNGKFPETFNELITLPGIGEYTAAAIASIAHQEPVAVVDGNVFRVLARVFGVDTIINSPAGKREFSELANRVLDSKNPDIHNQAMMEFGALFCTPKTPMCYECIFKSSCEAFRGDLQYVLPVKQKSKKSSQRYFYYLVIRKGKSIAMKKREEKDIWNGLYDFPLIVHKRAISESQLIKDFGGQIKVSKTFKHILSHQTIHARFIVTDSVSNSTLQKSTKFYSAAQIANLPKPVLISRFLDSGHLS
jgi:A/G-specific adenine glycosylase